MHANELQEIFNFLRHHHHHPPLEPLSFDSRSLDNAYPMEEVVPNHSHSSRGKASRMGVHVALGLAYPYSASFRPSYRGSDLEGG